MSSFNQKVTNILGRLNSNLKDILEQSLDEDEFSIELTKQTMKYAKMRIINEIDHLILKEVEKFKTYNLVIDYSSLTENLDLILKSMKSIEKEMKIEDLKIDDRKEITRLIVSFPNETSVSTLNKYRRLLLMSLREQQIVPVN